MQSPTDSSLLRQCRTDTNYAIPGGSQDQEGAKLSLAKQRSEHLVHQAASTLDTRSDILGTMIHTPTVLILGAGASTHVGYPIGSSLIDQICSRARDGHYHDYIRELYAPDVDDFWMRLSRSGYDSIDAFLEANKNLIPLGKLLIADCMKQYENEDALFPPHSSGWYQYLLNRMMTGDAAEFLSNKISIVTFNYDRSLEAYLTQAIKHRLQLPDAEAADLVRRLVIIHPHGTLGPYPEMPYSTDLDRDTLITMGDSISIPSELEDSAEGFSSADFQVGNELLQAAQKVYFLGFGFHDENLRRFRFFTADALEGKEVCSTIMGPEPTEKAELLARLAEYGLSERCLPDQYLDCESFFRRRGRLE